MSCWCLRRAGRWLGLLVLAGGVLTASLSAQPPGPGKDKGPKGPGDPAEKAGHHLHRAYDALAEVAALANAEKARPPREAARLTDLARDLYRQAHRAYRDSDYPRAEEMGAAANDAARGLTHVLRAGLPVPAGLPAPPEDAALPPDKPKGEKPGKPKGQKPEDRGPRGAWTPALDALGRAREHIRNATDQTPAKGPGRDFLDAARDTYDRARRAYGDGDYARAAELAHGAEAWAHVGEHLNRAGPVEPLPAPADAPRGRDAGRAPPPPPALDR
jgi:hypothetical protein